MKKTVAMINCEACKKPINANRANRVDNKLICNECKAIKELKEEKNKSLGVSTRDLDVLYSDIRETLSKHRKGSTPRQDIIDDTLSLMLEMTRILRTDRINKGRANE